MNENKVRDTQMLNERKHMASGWMHGRPVEDVIEECLRVHVGKRGLVLDSFIDFENNGEQSVRFYVNVLKIADQGSRGLNEVDPEFTGGYVEIYQDGGYRAGAPVHQPIYHQGMYNQYNPGFANSQGGFNNGGHVGFNKWRIVSLVLGVVVVGGGIYVSKVKKDSNIFKKQLAAANERLDTAIGEIKFYDDAITKSGYVITNEGKVEKK